MLKIGLLVALIVTATVFLTAWIAERRERSRRRASRARRAVNYEQRRSEWGSYLRLNSTRGVHRLTDESASDD